MQNSKNNRTGSLRSFEKSFEKDKIFYVLALHCVHPPCSLTLFDVKCSFVLCTRVLMALEGLIALDELEVSPPPIRSFTETDNSADVGIT